MKPLFSGVVHDFVKVEIQSFFEVFFGRPLQAVLRGKKCMAGETQSGIVQTARLEIFPCVQALFGSELIGKPRHQKQRISLLDNLIPLQAVKANMMIAGTVIGFERFNVNGL